MRAVSIILVTAVLGFSCNAFAQNADPICAELTGAAYGQCTAAVAVGCDGSATQPAGCVKIAENFTRLTGATPPWELPTVSCPCFSLDSAIADIEAHLASGQSLVWYTGFVSSGVDEWFGTYVKNNLGELFPDYYVGRAFIHTSSDQSFCLVHPSDVFEERIFLNLSEEGESCIRTLRIAASKTGIPEFKE